MPFFQMLYIKVKQGTPVTAEKPTCQRFSYLDLERKTGLKRNITEMDLLNKCIT